MIILSSNIGHFFNKIILVMLMKKKIDRNCGLNNIVSINFHGFMKHVSLRICKFVVYGFAKINIM